MCLTYAIDESHGIKHAKGTMLRAQQIISSLPKITEAESKMALYAAALHDMCDHKYTDVEKSSKEIYEWLIDSSNLWSTEEAAALIHIITTMSYSKLKAHVVNDRPVFPDHGKWQISYEVARHADLLESYVVARCVLYNKHIHPDLDEDAHWNRARELFEERVFNYVKDGWITLPGAVDLVPSLEAEARRCLDERSMDW